MAGRQCKWEERWEKRTYQCSFCSGSDWREKVERLGSRLRHSLEHGSSVGGNAQERKSLGSFLFVVLSIRMITSGGSWLLYRSHRLQNDSRRDVEVRK